MVEYLEVSPEMLKKDHDALMSEVELALADVKELRSDLSVLSGRFQGYAGDAFVNRMENDLNYIESVCGQLRQLADQLTEAKTEYENCERNVADLIQSIPV